MNDILLDFLTSDYNQEIRYVTWVAKKVISCETCNGTGYIRREELTDYHRREYSTFVDECRTCRGDGRLTKTTENLKFETNYPIKDLATERVTTTPYSEEPIKLDWASEIVRGRLKPPKRTKPEDEDKKEIPF